MELIVLSDGVYSLVQVTKDHSAIFIRVLVAKMFMFVINGDKDSLKDNVQIFSIIIVKF